MDSLVQGLRELGWVEGRNLAIERRFAENRDERLPGLAAELVRSKVEVLLAGGPSATRAAKGATDTIPIVMGTHDPVEQGLVASLAKPGGNVTGWCFLSAETAEKQLALLKQALPRAGRVAVLVNPGLPGHGVRMQHIERGARALGLRLSVLDIATAEALAPAFAAMASERVDAFIVIPEPTLIDGLRGQIVAAASRQRLPGMYMFRMYTEAGGLMSYGPDLLALTRGWAPYVDKILRGAKPADLPVQTPTKLELILNERAAREIGFTFPGSLVLAADHIIK